MLSKVKAFVNHTAYLRIRSLIRSKVYVKIRPLILSNPYVAGKFYPLGGTAAEYVVPLPSTSTDSSNNDNLPLPPEELWEGYADSAEDYLASGRADMATMLSILERAGDSP